MGGGWIIPRFHKDKFTTTSPCTPANCSIPRSTNSFSTPQEFYTNIYESVRDEKSNEKGGDDANLSHPGRGVPDKATFGTGQLLRPG